MTGKRALLLQLERDKGEEMEASLRLIQRREEELMKKLEVLQFQIKLEEEEIRRVRELRKKYPYTSSTTHVPSIAPHILKVKRQGKTRQDS
jgi:hypothetical protein